jgi:hypothetical protein
MRTLAGSADSKRQPQYTPETPAPTIAKSRTSSLLPFEGLCRDSLDAGIESVGIASAPAASAARAIKTRREVFAAMASHLRPAPATRVSVFAKEQSFCLLLGFGGDCVC